MIKNKTKRAIIILKEEGIYTLVKKIFKYLLNKFQFFLFPYFLFKIKKFDSDGIKESIEFVFNKLPLIKPFQIREEISQLLQILKEREPKFILEIGTEGGGTLFLFSRVASDDAKIISIDLPGGKFGGGYPEWKIPIYKAFVKGNQKIYLLRKDSHEEETLEEVKKILNGNQLDFLFIDGDHTYEGVKRDFKMYNSLVKKGGIISFHDIVPGPKENVGGVPKFWEEIKRNFQIQEIVKNWNQNGYGLGVIFKFKL